MICGRRAPILPMVRGALASPSREIGECQRLWSLQYGGPPGCLRMDL